MDLRSKFKDENIKSSNQSVNAHARLGNKISRTDCDDDAEIGTGSSGDSLRRKQSSKRCELNGSESMFK